MKIENVERVARGLAAVVGTVLLAAVVVTPSWWWGMLGVVPLAIALGGW